jgi:transposase
LQTDEQRTADEQALWERRQQHAALRQVAALVRQGTAMIRQRQADDLDAWLQTCRASPSVEFQHCVDVLQRDSAAVKAAFTLPLVNGVGCRAHQPPEADQAEWIWPHAVGPPPATSAG